MKYLCVETSGITGFVSLFSNSKKEFEYTLNAKGHSEKIVLKLPSLLSHLEKTNSKIKFIAVDTGPGRFTGLRVGVNFSKTLAYYLKIPIYPCCSLRIMVDPYLKDKEEPVVCLMEAFGQMFYMGIYKRSKNGVENIISPLAVYINELEKYITQPMLCVGDVYSKKYNLFPKKIRNYLNPVEDYFISPESFSRTILSEWSLDRLQSWHEVKPCYLRIPGLVP